MVQRNLTDICITRTSTVHCLYQHWHSVDILDKRVKEGVEKGALSVGCDSIFQLIPSHEERTKPEWAS